ncbi:MAG: hypothetical protein RMM31_11180 [Anaerolineae bacterium]|nr:hypothetical protein [Anaerolineae bacterium]
MLFLYTTPSLQQRRSCCTLQHCPGINLVATLHFRGIPDALYAELRRIAQASGTSISALVVQHLQHLVHSHQTRQALLAQLEALEAASASSAPPAPPQDAVALLQAARAERAATLLDALDR